MKTDTQVGAMSVGAYGTPGHWDYWHVDQKLPKPSKAEIRQLAKKLFKGRVLRTSIVGNPGRLALEE